MIKKLKIKRRYEKTTLFSQFLFSFYLIKEVTWYHQGSDELQIARYWIAQYSLPR